MKKLIISLLFLSLLCTQASAANLEELRTKYDAVSSFSGGTAVVLSWYKYGLMDEQWNEIIPIWNYDISTWRYRESGWVLLPNNLHGYLEYSDNGSTFTIANASGTILQKTNYTEVSSYHTSNYIVVKQNGKYWMISADTMKVILPIKFTKISQYNNDIVVLE